MRSEHFFSSSNKLGEGPLWSPEEQALYWVDIEQHRLHRMIIDEKEMQTVDVGAPVSVLGLRERGGLILGVYDHFALYQPGQEHLQVLARISLSASGARLNDGAVDPRGDFWAGTMSPDGQGCLYRISPDGQVRIMETGLSISNGIAWSPDRRKMYLADSGPGVIYVYDYGPASGEIANRRVFVDAREDPGVPDGLTVDAEGFIWSAHWGGWKVVRYDPEGKVAAEVKVPVEFPTSCAYGGPGMDELYITSAWTAVENRSEQPLAGDIFRLHPGVRGLPPYRFKG